MIRALSVRQPYAGLIMEPHPDLWFKDVENRTWQTDYRGPVIIHAGKRWAEFDADYAQTHSWFAERVTSARGAFLGVVDLIDIRVGARSVWADEGHYHWVLANPRPFRRPVVGAGRQGLWTPEITDELQAALDKINYRKDA